MKGIVVNNTEDKLLKTSVVAKRLGVHRDTVLTWLNNGILPGTRLPGRAGWRISESDLEKWLAARKHGETE